MPFVELAGSDYPENGTRRDSVTILAYTVRLYLASTLSFLQGKPAMPRLTSTDKIVNLPALSIRIKGDRTHCVLLANPGSEFDGKAISRADAARIIRGLRRRMAEIDAERNR